MQSKQICKRTMIFCFLIAVVGATCLQRICIHLYLRTNYRAYPEYYELISTPMDLSTVKEKIGSNEYANVTEALQDLRTIWDNCRQFNVEGSDILQSAETCAELLEVLVEVRSCRQLFCFVDC